MFDGIAPSEAGDGRAQAENGCAPALQRTRGSLDLAFRRPSAGAGLRSVPLRLYQDGALRARLPRVPAGDCTELVLINTAGGLTGGDRLDIALSLEPGAELVVTSQASEKIYRSAGGDAVVTTRLDLAAGAALDWLPQPSILFDRARLDRTLSVDLAPGARLLAVEGCIFGREAHGERFSDGLLKDAWRVRRGGRLVMADALRADGAASLAGPATLAGQRAAASLVYVAEDAPHRLEAARAALAETGLSATGASAWDGLLAVRLAARDGGSLCRGLAAFLTLFRGAPLPRVWSC